MRMHALAGYSWLLPALARASVGLPLLCLSGAQQRVNAYDPHLWNTLVMAYCVDFARRGVTAASILAVTHPVTLYISGPVQEALFNVHVPGAPGHPTFPGGSAIHADVYVRFMAAAHAMGGNEPTRFERAARVGMSVL